MTSDVAVAVEESSGRKTLSDSTWLEFDINRFRVFLWFLDPTKELLSANLKPKKANSRF